METNDSRTSSAAGALLGAAVADAMGLPCEGLSRSRQARLYPRDERPSLVFGHGMVSDDADHAIFTAHALAESRLEPDSFRLSLARSVRQWILSAPPGIGLATLRSGIRLLVGVPPTRSGVFSAGNGPAMRAPIIGAACAHDIGLARRLVEISTRLTHTDPKAVRGSWAIAVAAKVAAGPGPVRPDEFGELYRSTESDRDDVFDALIDRTAESVNRKESTAAFADALGLSDGVTGYIYNTVPIVLHSWLSQPEDYATAVTQVIKCGGDTDTTAAIVGGLIGARVGTAGIPATWVQSLLLWPFSTRYYDELAAGLSAGTAPPREPLRPAITLRNAFQTGAILTHAARRALPPY